MKDIQDRIFNAIRAGDVGELRKAIAQATSTHALLNEVHPEHQSPLLFALRRSPVNLEIVRALLESGADPNLSVNNSLGLEEAPMHIAAATMQLDLIQLLVEFGGDLHHCVQSNCGIGDPVARRAAKNPEAAREIFTYLLDQGVDLSTTSTYGESVPRLLACDGQVNLLRFLEEHGVSLEPLEWSPLHRIVAFGSLADLEAALHDGPNLESVDSWSLTPYLLAAVIGDPMKMEKLARAGARTDAENHVSMRAAHLAADNDRTEVLAWLEAQGEDLGALSRMFGNSVLDEAIMKDHLRSTRFLLERGMHRATRLRSPEDVEQQRQQMREMMSQFGMGVNPELIMESMESALFDPSQQDADKKLLDHAQSGEMLRLLEEFGVSFSQAPQEVQFMRLGLDSASFEPNPLPSQAEFKRGRRRRFGTSNPEEISEPFWHFMVKSRWGAYGARRHFGGRDSFLQRSDPIWCNDRMGQSMTLLPDGRALFIGGEHEDGYDPDFCIYNDVIVIHPDRKVQIFEYPEAVFPPTDFHTATLVGDWIYIVGSLGYQGKRESTFTPVWRLNIHSYAIESVKTTGDSPGRVNRHHTRLVDEDKLLVYGGKVSGHRNGKEFYETNTVTRVLSLGTLHWSDA